MTELTRGDRVGSFVLVRRLGAGTHGETWLADDAAGARRVALKIPTVRVPREQAEREAELQRQFAHPAVAAVHGLAELADGRVAIVQEYLSGGDLSKLRARPWPQVLTAVRPVLDALVAMANAGIAHGDLKPANLVRDEAGAAKLVDFGVAALAASSGAPTGSPYTRSPAQWRGAAPAPADDAYGFGALLYELLAGHPPYYPNVSQGRVEHELVPPLHAPHPVPDALLALVDRLLAKDPAARATLEEARVEIERALADAPVVAAESMPRPEAIAPKLAPPTRGGGGAWQPAPPAPVGRTSVLAGSDGARTGSRSPVALGIGGLLALAIVGVFFLLPRWVERHPVKVDARVAGPTAPDAKAVANGAAPANAAGAGAAAAGGAATNAGAAPAAGAASGPKPLPTDPAALAALAQAKTRAEDARTDYDAVLKPLVDARAELWGGADWARLQAAGTDAKKQYDDRDYAAAGATWSSGVALAKQVQAARAPALAAALAAGRDGLDRGDSRAALAGFDRALAIEPKNAVAAAGRTRAQNLDRVLALVDEGTNFERAGQPSAATEKYRAALAIDAQASAATAGLARIAAQARRDAFAQAMAQGQRALAAGNRDAARAAFERARAIDPQDASVRDALAQVDTGDRTAKLAALRAQAEAAERAERWADAVKTYDAALALDPTVTFAQDGRARAQPRADLARRIDAYLHRPDALDDPEERASARQLLAAAADVPGEPTLLRRQQQALDAALRAAETPVRLALASDNQTEVLVYRVGKLGAFQSRELELLPGRYTIVGRRPGFRDVRREVVVPPGGTGNSVEIRCTDPI
jgi:Tfp pilus assembly protein PilF